MAATIHWRSFYPYTVPRKDNDPKQNINGFNGFLYDILLQMFQICQPNLDTHNFQMTRYPSQRDFMSFLHSADVADGSTHVFLPVSVSNHGCYLERLHQQMLPDSTFLPVLESPGEANSVH